LMAPPGPLARLAIPVRTAPMARSARTAQTGQMAPTELSAPMALQARTASTAAMAARAETDWLVESAAMPAMVESARWAAPDKRAARGGAWRAMKRSSTRERSQAAQAAWVEQVDPVASVETAEWVDLAVSAATAEMAVPVDLVVQGFWEATGEMVEQVAMVPSVGSVVPEGSEDALASEAWVPSEAMAALGVLVFPPRHHSRFSIPASSVVGMEPRVARPVLPEPMVSTEPMGPEGMPGLEAMAVRAALVVLVTPVLMAKTPPLAEQVARLETAAQAASEVLEPALRPMEPTATAATVGLEDLAAMAESEGLESMAPMEHLRVPLALQVAMVETEPMAELVEPEGLEERQEELELLPEQMALAATVALAERREPQEMVGLVPQAMRHL
jgi:hypothetical protein